MIGFDLGATNLHAGVVSETGQLQDVLIRQYPGNDFDTVISLVCETVAKFRNRFPDISRMGVVCPGQVQVDQGLLINPINMDGWGSVALVKILEEKTGLRVFLDNDAVGAALAEGWIGQARDMQTYICVTLGTGVGTGVVIDGRVFRGAGGYGCEWGHIAMEADGPYECGCGNRGCIETHCSATALVRLAADNGIAAATAREVCNLADAGNGAALRTMEVFSQYLAQALYNYIMILNPETVVLCGGLSAAAPLFLARVKESVAARLSRRRHMLPSGGVRVSGFSDESGIIGAAYLCLEEGRIKR